MSTLRMQMDIINVIAKKRDLKIALDQLRESLPFSICYASIRDKDNKCENFTFLVTKKEEEARNKRDDFADFVFNNYSVKGGMEIINKTITTIDNADDVNDLMSHFEFDSPNEKIFELLEVTLALEVSKKNKKVKLNK